MVIYEWKDNYGEAGHVCTFSGHGVRLMLWDCDGSVAVHIVPPATAREIAAALLQAAEKEETVQ